MGGLIADRLAKEGFRLARSVDAALPMPVWTLDLELERFRETSAAELAVLRLVDAGLGATDELTRLMGMGTDMRLTEQVLVRLLGAQAVEPKGDRFILTEVGRASIRSGGATARERVTFDVRLDPARNAALEWMDSERSVVARDTWTIDLPPVAEDAILSRKPEVAELVRKEPLPDEHERAPNEERPPVELRSFTLMERRTHWRAVRLDEWRHADRVDATVVAYIGDAEHPPLTNLLGTHVLVDDQRRVVPR